MSANPAVVHRRLRLALPLKVAVALDVGPRQIHVDLQPYTPREVSRACRGLMGRSVRVPADRVAERVKHGVADTTYARPPGLTIALCRDGECFSSRSMVPKSRKWPKILNCTATILQWGAIIAEHDQFYRTATTLVG